MSEGLNEHRKMLLMRGRPKILLTTNYEVGLHLFEKYRLNLLGVISDVKYFKDGVPNREAGFDLLKYVRSKERYFPFLMQSSDKTNEKKTSSHRGVLLSRRIGNCRAGGCG